MFNINKSLIFDPGVIHYLVDSNFRTAAQGWTQSDGTGPLDLWNAKNPGTVFYTDGGPIAAGGTTDALATQAAIDAMVDFRGDTLYFTPGSYSLASVVAFNVANARYLGPKTGHPKASRVTLTDAVGDHTLAVNDVEFAYLNFVPLTAQNFFAIASGDRAWFHHFYYNSDGIGASTSTEFINASAQVVDWLIEDFAVHVDAAQGDFLTLTSPARWLIQRGDFIVEGGTWASVVTFATTPIGMRCDLLWFNGSGTSSVYTNIFTGVANSNMQLLATRLYLNGSAIATDGAIETTFGTATDIDLAECFYSGDATTQGGLLAVLD